MVQVLNDHNYPNIYHRHSMEFQVSPEETDDMGFRTTAVTRHYLTNDMIGVLRANVVKVQFGIILEQMRTFVYDKLGRPRHMPGRHDDMMFGLGLAIHGDLNLPKDFSKGFPAYTDEDSLDTGGGGSRFFEKPAKTIDDLAYAGCYDDFDEEEDDGWSFTD